MKIDSSTIGIVAHDLKGPIGNIGMFSEMLASMLESAQSEIGDSYDLSTSIWYANYIQTIGSKYVDQLQNWTDLLMIQSKSIQLHQTFIDISALIKTTLSQNALFIDKKKIQIIDEIENSIISFSDSDMMRRVLDNLIQLVVLLINQKESIHVHFQKKESLATFKISGLAKTDAHLFTELYVKETDLNELSAFSKGLIKVSGLGLAFCYSAITLCDGTTFIEEKDQKLSICFSIPVSDV